MFRMKVCESIDIDATPEQIWPFIADPQQMAAWHVKLVSVSRSGKGPVYLGDRFETIYEMSGRRRQATAEIVYCQPPTGLTLRHRIAEMGSEHFVDETYELTSRGGSTRVAQSVDFSNAGFPLWARGLMWFISRFGYSVGEGILEPLKRACEKGQDG
jgi:carbon monoxide dehydrogenase subunit G